MLSKRTQNLSYEEVVKLIQNENIWINSFGLMLLQQMHNIQRECIIKIVSYVVVVNLIVRHIISRHIFLHSNLIASVAFNNPPHSLLMGIFNKVLITYVLLIRNICMDERSCIVKPAFTVVGHNCKQITQFMKIQHRFQFLILITLIRLFLFFSYLNSFF